MTTRHIPAELRQDAKLCLSLRQAEKERLLAVAGRKGLTLSYVVREIIRDYLARADPDGD